MANLLKGVLPIAHGNMIAARIDGLRPEKRGAVPYLRFAQIGAGTV